MVDLFKVIMTTCLFAWKRGAIPGVRLPLQPKQARTRWLPRRLSDELAADSAFHAERGLRKRRQVWAHPHFFTSHFLHCTWPSPARCSLPLEHVRSEGLLQL